MADHTTPIPARPTTYKGIKMRSRLEAAYAEQFDAFGWTWTYEPQCFATEEGQYLPDFMLDFSDPEYEGAVHVYVEVKPNIPKKVLEYISSATVWHQICAANDEHTTGFMLMLGADVAERLNWYAHTKVEADRDVAFAGWHSVIPRRTSWGDVVCVRHRGHTFAGMQLYDVEPVSSLYAQGFVTPPTPVWEDDVALALWGF